jgi:O-antigen/teichoic acid export membrane protein
MKLCAGIIFLKFSAVYLDLDEIAVLGQLTSIVAIIFLISGGGVTNGIIKYVAEYQETPIKLIRFLISAKAYSLTISMLILIICITFAFPISKYLLGDSKLSWFIITLGFTQLGFSFTNIVLGVTNGLTNTKIFAYIQITSYLLALPVMWLLIKSYGLIGSAYALLVMFGANFLPAYYVYKKSVFNLKISGYRYKIVHIKDLATYTLMALAGALSVPLTEIIIRTAIISQVSPEAAGIWQASLKISSAYMGFFVIFLTVYFLPLASKTHEHHKLQKLVNKFYILISILFIFCGFLIYIPRTNIILILLSTEFLPLSDLILYQLIGDFFRVLSFIIGFVIIGKAALRLYLISEISQAVIFLTISFYFLSYNYGLKGVLMSHIFMNFSLFVFYAIGFRIYIKLKKAQHVNC